MLPKIAILCTESEHAVLELQCPRFELLHVTECADLIRMVEFGINGIIVLGGVETERIQELKEIKGATLSNDQIYVIGDIYFPTATEGLTIPHTLQGDWDELLAGVQKAIAHLTNSSDR